MTEHLRTAFEELLKKYPVREIELKSLCVVWEATNYGEDPLPTKIPILIGPTSTGKTFTVRELGKIMGAFVKVLLLQQENPDEVAGYLVPVNGKKIETEEILETNGYHLRYAKPEWFQELEKSLENYRIVFLDEIDKAPRELLAPVLTFIRDKVLRKWRVPQATFLIGAMNPTEKPFDEAFIARCIFIPWLHNKEEYSSLFPSLKDAVGNFKYREKIILPALLKEPDKAALHFLDVARKHPWFWDEKVREVLVRGMLAPAAAEVVLRLFERKIRPPVEVLIRNPELTRKIIHAMNEEDVFLLYREMHPMFCHWDPSETRVFGEFHLWGWEDETGERAHRFQEFVAKNISIEEHAKVALHPGIWKQIKTVINGDGTEESFRKSLVYRTQVKRWEIENHQAENEEKNSV